jgi:hypothetical protein
MSTPQAKGLVGHEYAAITRGLHIVKYSIKYKKDEKMGRMIRVSLMQQKQVSDFFPMDRLIIHIDLKGIFIPSLSPQQKQCMQ